MYRTLGKADPGSRAPEFRARDVLGREFATGTCLGRGNLVIFFYRNSLCRTCREELVDLADRYPLVSGQDAEVVAISTDGFDVAKNMAVDLRLPYPVISDPDANIIKLYGAYDEAGDTAFPTLLIVDRQGVVRFRKTIEGLNDLEPADDIVNRLTDMGRLSGKKPLEFGRLS